MSLAVQIAGHGSDGDPLKAILKRKFCKLKYQIKILLI